MEWDDVDVHCEVMDRDWTLTLWSTEKFTHIYSISTNNVYLSQYQKKMRKTKINVCRKLLKYIYISEFKC